MIKSKVLKWILLTLRKTSTNWVSVTSRRHFMLATSRFSVLGIPKITTPRFSNSLGGLTGHSMLLYLGLMIYYSKRIQGKISKRKSPEETSASSSGITQETIPPAKNCDNTFVWNVQQGSSLETQYLKLLLEPSAYLPHKNFRFPEWKQVLNINHIYFFFFLVQFRHSELLLLILEVGILQKSKFWHQRDKPFQDSSLRPSVL